MRLRSLIASVSLAAAMLGPAVAWAALYTWNTTGSLSPGAGGPCAGGAACKAVFGSTTGAQVLTARVYSTPIYDNTAPFNVSGNWIEGRIALYSGGIGVANRVSGDASNELSVPAHAIDNRSAKDIVVFELPAGEWDPESFKLGWADSDSDVQAWIGGTELGSSYDFRNVCFSGTNCATLASLGFTELTAWIPAVSGGTRSPGGQSAAGGLNVPTGVAVPFNTTRTGRYLVMAGSLQQENDFFKISQVSATRVQALPVPGSLMLSALGLLLLSWVRVGAVARSGGAARIAVLGLPRHD